MKRVLLAVTPQLFRDALRACLEQSTDVEVVGEVANPLELLVAVGDCEADLVIQSWPDDGRMPAICSHLFAEYPDLRIVGITKAGDEVVVCRQVIAATPIREPELQSLLATIRAERDSVCTMPMTAYDYMHCNN